MLLLILSVARLIYIIHTSQHDLDFFFLISTFIIIVGCRDTVLPRWTTAARNAVHLRYAITVMQIRKLIYAAPPPPPKKKNTHTPSFLPKVLPRSAIAVGRGRLGRVQLIDEQSVAAQLCQLLPRCCSVILECQPVVIVRLHLLPVGRVPCRRARPHKPPELCVSASTNEFLVAQTNSS